VINELSLEGYHFFQKKEKQKHRAVEMIEDKRGKQSGKLTRPHSSASRGQLVQTDSSRMLVFVPQINAAYRSKTNIVQKSEIRSSSSMRDLAGAMIGVGWF